MNTKTIRYQGETYVKVAEGDRTWVEYEMDAHEAFFKDVLRKLKEVAGGHLKEASTKRGRSVVWLEYTGQDLSDIDLEWHCHLVPSQVFDITLYWEARSAMNGPSKGSVPFKSGLLTVDKVVGVFKDSFGSGRTW
jgi:hypothetical protein